ASPRSTPRSSPAIRPIGWLPASTATGPAWTATSISSPYGSRQSHRRPPRCSLTQTAVRSRGALLPLTSYLTDNREPTTNNSTPSAISPLDFRPPSATLKPGAVRPHTARGRSRPPFDISGQSREEARRGNQRQEWSPARKHGPPCGAPRE